MSIGETLAAARGEAGLTLAQVSRVTCVRQTILDGIENDDFSLCGGDFYARGHIRSFARTVGIDPEPLVRRYDDEHGGSPRAARFAEDLEATPLSVSRGRRPNWSVAMAAMLVVVVITYGAFRIFSPGPAGDDRTGPLVRATSSTSSPAATPSPKETGQAGSGGSEPSKTPAKPDGVQLSLSASAPTWVSASGSGGETIFRDTLREGETVRWSDDRRIRLVIGNAGGVSLTVNGQDFGVVGENGAVVPLDIYPDRVEGLPEGQ